MARRRGGSNEAGVNLDSLMDALTNVVGILIIVFVLVQLKVTKVVEHDLENMKEVTEEEVAKLREEVDEKQKMLVVLNKEVEEQEEKDPAVTEDLKLRRIERERLAKANMLNIDFEAEDKLQEQIDNLKKQLAPIRTEEEQLGAERTRLAGLLDTTKPAVAEAALQIRMPNPRSIPEGAVIYNFWVAPDRVLYLNEPEYVKQFQSEFERIRKDVKVGERKLGGNRDPIPQYDGGKIQKYMEDKGRLGSRDFVSTVHSSPTSNRVAMRLEPTETGGETLKVAQAQNSNYQRALRKIKSERTSVIMFYVDRQAIETYLEVRKHADLAQVPAGWKMQWNPFFQFAIPDLEVKRLKDPPPPDEGGTFKVSAPKDGLD